MKDTSVSEILFRKAKDGEIVAIMPYEIVMTGGPSLGYMWSYEHCGQHSQCHPSFVKETKPATPAEYSDLKKELEDIGYNVKVIKRINQKKYLKKVAELRKM